MTRPEINKTLIKTLAQMPDEFTSYQFGKKLRKNGVDPIKSKVRMDRFLIQYCDYPSTRRWAKRKTAESRINKMDVQITEVAINFLKEKGYKILKQEWKEV